MGKLTNKQRAFVDHYFQCWNATEAAARARYRGDRVTLGAIGYENLRKPQIAELVQKRLAEMAMDADEILAHLASIARGSAADILDVSAGKRGMLDLARAEKRGALHLIEKLEWTRDGLKVGLYDRLNALQLLGKAHRLFVDRKEHSGPDGGSIPIEHSLDLSGLNNGDLSCLIDNLKAAVRGSTVGETPAEDEQAE